MLKYKKHEIIVKELERKHLITIRKNPANMFKKQIIQNILYYIQDLQFQIIGCR